MMFNLIRQCSVQQFVFLMQVCKPSLTEHAAMRIDAAIANTIFSITDTMRFLPLWRGFG